MNGQTLDRRRDLDLGDHRLPCADTKFVRRAPDPLSDAKWIEAAGREPVETKKRVSLVLTSQNVSLSSTASRIC